MPATTIGQAGDPAPAIAALPDTDSCHYGCLRPDLGLSVRFIDRAGRNPLTRVELSDGSSVSFTFVGVPAGAAAVSQHGAHLVASYGQATLTMQVGATADGRAQLKETILLSAPPPGGAIAWAVTCSGAARHMRNADGSGGLGRLTPAGVVREYALPAPTAWDADGVAIPIRVVWDGHVLAYALGLTGAESYPITVDPTTVSTSTSGAATAPVAGHNLLLASDDTAFALWYDGNSLKWGYASSPYTSWTTATLAANTGSPGAATVLGASDTIYAAYTPAGTNAHFACTKFTKSGAAWTAGAAVALPDIPGGHAQAGDAVSACVDANGALWVASSVWGGSTFAAYVYTDGGSGGATWSTALAADADIANYGYNNLAIAATGNYVVLMWTDESVDKVRWKRHLLTDPATAWDAAQTFTGGSFVFSSQQASAAVDGAGRILYYLASNGSNAAVMCRYDPTADAWTNDGALGAVGADGPGQVVGGGTDAYAVWPQFVASNSYAVVYRTWHNASATWDAASTTLEAAGAQRTAVQGAATSGLLAAMWTEGTASPYDVQFDSLSLGGGTGAALAGNAGGVGGATASALIEQQPLAGSAGGVGGGTASALAEQQPLGGSGAGVGGAVAPNLAEQQPVAGNAGGVGGGSAAALIEQQPVAGSAGGVGGASPARLIEQQPLAGSAAGVGGAYPAPLNEQQPLAGVAGGVGGTTGTLAPSGLSGATGGVGGASAVALVEQQPLSGTAGAIGAAMGGVLIEQQPLAGQSGGVGGASGTLGADNALAGQTGGAGGAAATALAEAQPLVGSAAGVGGGAGALQTVATASDETLYAQARRFTLVAKARVFDLIARPR